MGRGLEHGGANGSTLRLRSASRLCSFAVPPCHCSLPGFPSSLPTPSQPHDRSAQLSQRLSQPLPPTAKSPVQLIPARQALGSQGQQSGQHMRRLSSGQGPSVVPVTVSLGQRHEADPGAVESASRPRSRPFAQQLSPACPPATAAAHWPLEPSCPHPPPNLLKPSLPRGIMAMDLLCAHQVVHAHHPQGSCPPGASVLFLSVQPGSH